MGREPIADTRYDERRPASEFRAPLLSVYYASLGSEFEVRGAPSVFLPPQVNLLPLAEALQQLEPSPTRLREAIWLLVRATTVKGSCAAATERYPRELLEYLPLERQEELSRLRRDYRSGGNLFAAAMVACRDNDWEQVEEIRKITVARRGKHDFSRAIAPLFDNKSAPELLTSWSAPQTRQGHATQIRNLEAEVGMNIHDFILQFADAAAFQVFSRKTSLGGGPVVTGETALTVLPVTSVVAQNTATLATKATVTTIVTGEFEQLRRVTDPLAWACSSDVVQSCRYVADPFPDSGAAAAPQGELGMGFDGARLLEEQASLSWGEGNDQHASFHNILRVQHSVVDQPQREYPVGVDIRFSLSRSVESAVLWDRQPGGLLANQGYLKVRPLGNRSWRVTSQKNIRFSDRTPSSRARGWSDFGQLLNYLAPTALSWWVETETYSLGDLPADDQRSTPAQPSGGTP